MDLLIRACQHDDLPKLLQLYKHLHKVDASLPAHSVLQQVWQEMLDDPKIHLLVGEYDGKTVSSCILIIVPNLSRGARPYGLIENVVTHNLYRRMGFGTSILQNALNIAWENNCYKVMLLTGRQDESIYRFYERAGFRRGIKTGFIATHS